MKWDSPKTALYVVGVLVGLMGLWGLVAYFVPSMAFGFVVDLWWHSVLKLVVAAYALWVASKA